MSAPLNRRGMLQQAGMGFGGIALQSLLSRESAADAGRTTPDGAAHFAPKAKSVIWLFMAGGVSQLESFDPKPALNKYAGKSIGETPYKDALASNRVSEQLQTGFGRQIMKQIFPLQVGYRKRGEAGIEISDWWSHLGECIDDISIVRSMWTTDNNHQAQYQFHTGRPIVGGAQPSLGAWVHYGLGSLNDNLPQFVVLGRPVGPCCGGNLAHGSDYLGPQHAGVRFDLDGATPVPFLTPELAIPNDEQRRRLDLVLDLNRHAADQRPDDSTLAARIRSYELAFRMQSSVPHLLDTGGESQATLQMYGLDQKPEEKSFARQCLLARRMVESGVRFVQILHGTGDAGAWDAHGDLKTRYTKLCAEVDRPIAALLRDLKQRGLLDSTIVVFGTEFGRTPGLEDMSLTGSREGRDHHPYGFSAWLAGGGIRGGIAHGATDELGFHAVEDRHYVTDIHATILHQLGLDPRRMDVPGKKRIERDYGEPIHQIIA